MAARRDDEEDADEALNGDDVPTPDVGLRVWALAPPAEEREAPTRTEVVRCRTCRGEGTVTTRDTDEARWRQQRCPVCDGLGVVERRL